MKNKKEITVLFDTVGWIGICPVYISGIETPMPIIEPRHWVYEPLMLISEALLWVIYRFQDKPIFHVLVTGTLNPPLSKVFTL